MKDELERLGLEKVLDLPWEEWSEDSYVLNFWNSSMAIFKWGDWWFKHTRSGEVVRDCMLSDLTTDDFKYAFARYADV